MKIPQRDNAAWVEAIKNNNSAWISDLRYIILGWLLNQYQDEDYRRDCEDIAQESIIKIINGVGSYQNRAAFTTWAITITKHVAEEWFRRFWYKTRCELKDWVAYDQQDQISDELDIQKIIELLDYILRNNEQHRNIFIDSVILERPWQDICTDYGISHVNLNIIIKRTIDKLRVFYHEGIEEKREVQQISPITGKVVNVFDSNKAAAEYMGCNPSNISLMCTGRQKQAMGFIWRYSK